MATSIAAVFENGAFRPMTPLPLAEGTQVELIVVAEKKEQSNGNATTILAGIAALPTKGGDPSTSKNHDQVLYGEQGRDDFRGYGRLVRQCCAVGRQPCGRDSVVESKSFPLITTDYIIDETLTLLRARNESSRALILGERFFDESLAQIHFLDESEVRHAWQVFHGFADKDWSFTDCTSKVIIEKVAVKIAFAFDQHFRQFGSVQVQP